MSPVARRHPDAATAEAFRAFARGQAAGWSPSYERLAYAVAQDERVLGLLDGLPEAKRQPNLLFGVGRLLGGPVDDPDAFTGWVVTRWGDVEREVRGRGTQTNEAARCATLLPALLSLPGPLALLEVGASAGLCLYPDRYRYDYGDGVVGDGDGPVLRCRWLGDSTPPAARPEIVWRAGLDLHPLDVADPDHLRWLDCLVWPEHDERRDRLHAAARVVAQEPPLLVTGDLVADLPTLARRAPEEATLVVLHTAVLAYVDAPTRNAFVETVRGLGAHWLANEGPSLLTGQLPVPPSATADGPRPFLTALDGIPLGWSGPHGQSYRPLT